jgi:CrcB protein
VPDACAAALEGEVPDGTSPITAEKDDQHAEPARSEGIVEQLTPVLLVALGGALGAVARFVVATLFAKRVGAGWPYGTFFINMTGCFLIAWFLTISTERFPGLHPGWRFLFPIGFVGAYTTFSTYEFETNRLFEEGHVFGAAAYVVLSNVVGFLAVLLGKWVARRI